MRPRLVPFELAWTEAVFDAIFPDGTALPHGIRHLNLARYLDELLIAVPLDSSVFPTNLGVNPQHSIMAMSHLAAERIAERSVGRRAA